MDAQLRREARAAVLIAVATVLFSALAGIGWGLVAPTEQLFVVEQGRGALLTGESTHQFDGLAMFLCFGAVVGVLTAVAAWRWRTVRGPLMQAGVFFGSVLGAVAMELLGEQVTEWLHPRPHNPPVGQFVSLPVEVSGWLALIMQPLIASLVMLFFAALNPSEHLGTGIVAPAGIYDRAGAFGASAYPQDDAISSPYPAAGGTLPYGEYEPAREAGSGSMPESRPRR
ncbi:DUF2567 domain-containing protein [Nocardia altamirensis]|uniref:DUF2567 domain-containing protein n=1 Tax=Nocardia altamirensis TaxID=472158 RepID=UPI00083FFC74|nr:DUF2567 domain-containing protein [Nocardia altamirensis]